MQNTLVHIHKDISLPFYIYLYLYTALSVDPDTLQETLKHPDVLVWDERMHAWETKITRPLFMDKNDLCLGHVLSITLRKQRMGKALLIKIRMEPESITTLLLL